MIRTMKYSLYGLLFILCGCSSMRYYHVDSVPAGASITRAGEFVGQAPVGFKHVITKEDRDRGYFYSRPLVLKWVSGAEWRTDGFRIYLTDQNYRTYYINRPPSAPNKMADINYGLEIQKMDIMNAQLTTMRRASIQQSIQASSYNYPNAYPNPNRNAYPNNNWQQTLNNIQSAIIGF
jgi:hypothetical protein